MSFKNPKKDATFFIEYDARTDKFAAPQQVTVRSGDQVITTFPADSRAPKLVTVPIAAAQFGSGDMAELTLDVDQTFAPGAGDIRELGIRVFTPLSSPNSPPPLQLSRGPGHFARRATTSKQRQTVVILDTAPGGW